MTERESFSRIAHPSTRKCIKVVAESTLGISENVCYLEKNGFVKTSFWLSGYILGPTGIVSPTVTVSPFHNNLQYRRSSMYQRFAGN